MTRKTLNEIWDEFESYGKITDSTKRDLISHILDKNRPDRGIDLATEMGMAELAPIIAQQLDSEDDFMREFAVSALLSRMRLGQYAQKGLELAMNDSKEGVKDIAIGGLGRAFMYVEDPHLKKEIAFFLIKTFEDVNNDQLRREAAYFSIIRGTHVDYEDWPEFKGSPRRPIDFEKDIDWDRVNAFKDKFGCSV